MTLDPNNKTWTALASAFAATTLSPLNPDVAMALCDLAGWPDEYRMFAICTEVPLLKLSALTAGRGNDLIAGQKAALIATESQLTAVGNAIITLPYSEISWWEVYNNEQGALILKLGKSVDTALAASIDIAGMQPEQYHSTYLALLKFLQAIRPK